MVIYAILQFVERMRGVVVTLHSYIRVELVAESHTVYQAKRACKPQRGGPLAAVDHAIYHEKARSRTTARQHKFFFAGSGCRKKDKEVYKYFSHSCIRSIFMASRKVLY